MIGQNPKSPKDTIFSVGLFSGLLDYGAPNIAAEETLAFPCSVSVCEAHIVFLQSPRPLHQFNRAQIGLHTTGMESLATAA